MFRPLALATLIFSAATLAAQPPGGFPGGPGGGFGGPPGGQERKLIPQFDKDKDGRLNAEERAEARKFVKENPGRGGFGGRGGPGGPGGGPPGFGGRGEAPKPGPKVEKGDVKTVPGTSLYEPTALRTLFLDFENTADWEKELEDFHGTDVEVPCSLTVDGKTYKDVGTHFRGMSSYMGVRAGSKRSLNLSMDYADGNQRLMGAKTLNLLNGHDDGSFMDAVLYSQLAREHIPTPKANFVKVVINGESWGVYTNVQQFDKEFVKENYKSDKGTRWKVRGSPGGRGGMEYFGENVEDYKRVFEIKSKDDPKAWKALVKFCKVLNTTPADKLEAALAPLIDVDALLWFLAHDIAAINCDGYWIRSSDYSLYLDEKNKFHVIPHDMNECFRTPMGPGMGGGGMFVMLRPGDILPGPLQDSLALNAEQKKKIEALQKEADAKLEAMLTDEQKKQWKEMRSGPVGGIAGGPPGGGFPGGGPPGAGGPPGGGGRGPGGPGGGAGGVALDPLSGLDDARKPLRSKVLAVPAWRKTYLQHIHTIASEQFDWKNLGPVVAQYRKLIDAEVKADTRKLESYEIFVNTTADTVGRSSGRQMSLRQFADQRREALLNHPEVKKAVAK